MSRISFSSNPKTRKNRIQYEIALSRVNMILKDKPHSEEENTTDEQKKKEVKVIFDPIIQDIFDSILIAAEATCGNNQSIEDDLK